MSAAKLWADALKEYGNAFEVPSRLLIEIVDAYREENFEGADSPNLSLPDDLIAALLNELHSLRALLSKKPRRALSKKPRRAKKPRRRGPKALTMTEQRDLDSVIRRARALKADLIKDRMRKGEAHTTALQWAMKRLHEVEGVRVADSKVSRRLYGKT